ncbi:bifunctional NUDIX hydrolase/phosphatase PAP2 family protein [Vibrio cionasavignyae]|uniref:bifunctional NUDIX hydrolase/phosphatase PAP2 family protein n=1 Tax=Vibrio cionasavignyae TaxID=2910252 RepID=UPI003D1309D8
MTQILSHIAFTLLLALLTIHQSFASSDSTFVTSSKTPVTTFNELSDSLRQPFVHNDPPLAPTVRGALCLVRSDDRILLVDEIVTGKLSLPGGTIENNEDPRLAAQRETWEEAGLVVVVGRELGRTQRAVFYECLVESDIIAYSETNYGRGVELPIYFAPHFGVEVRSANLLSPKTVSPQEYRYPQQWPLVEDMFLSLSNQPISYIDNLISSAPRIHQVELSWLSSTQEALVNAPKQLQEVVLLGGKILYVLIQPLLLIAFLPLFIWLWGRHFTAQLMFAVTATSLFILVAKQGFSFPVPHAYLPTLNYNERSGFSFPDLLMANWICISSIVVSQIRPNHLGKFAIGAFFVTIIIAFYQFISGGAFLSDMLAGAIIGALVGWHFIRHHFSLTVSEDYTFTRTTVWVVLTVVAALFAYIWQFPSFLSWLALCVGMLLFAVASSYCPPRSRMCLRELLYSLSVILALLIGYFHLEDAVAHSGIGSLLLQTLVVPIIIIVPAVVMILFRNQQCR